MIDIMLTAGKIWLAAFTLLVVLVFLLHVLNKFDD